MATIAANIIHKGADPKKLVWFIIFCFIEFIILGYEIIFFNEFRGEENMIIKIM